VLLAVLGCPADSPNSDDAKKLDAQAKADMTAKTDASAKREAKAKAAEKERNAKAEAEAEAEAPERDPKLLDNNAQDTNRPRNDTAGEIPPDSTAPTARPQDVPEDWQRVAGDVWSFWVPKDWTVADVKTEGGGSTTSDKSATLERKEGDVVVSSLSCAVRSHDGLPTEPAAMKTAALDRAKAAAKKKEVLANVVKVDHEAGPQDAIQVEYHATGDGTLVIERWGLSQRALALVCTDESGKQDPADRKLLDTAIASLRWTTGS